MLNRVGNELIRVRQAHHERGIKLPRTEIKITITKDM
jgi:hypothetical protein